MRLRRRLSGAAPLGLPCQALVAGATCRWGARYWLDGHAVCGVHRRAKTVEYRQVPE